MSSFGIQSHLILGLDLWWYILPIANDASPTLFEGYSVGAGHFRSPHTTEVVGGAPQHEQIGKVRNTFLHFISSPSFKKIAWENEILKEELQKIVRNDG